MSNTQEYETKIADATRLAMAAGQRTLQLFRLGESEEEHAHELLKLCDFPVGAKVLDVGCGLGEVAKHFKAKRPDLDIELLNNNAFQLENCPEGFVKHRADMCATGLPAGSFDALLVCYTIGYADLGAALKEFDRLLKPGGVLFVADIAGDAQFARSALEYRLHELPYPQYVPAQYHTAHLKDLGPPELMEAVQTQLRPIFYRVVKKVALAFSGGKDSWACLHLNAHRLHEITVIWVNPGKNFPEAEAMVEKARAMCPNFVEVRSDRDGQNQREGIPSDIVPIDHTSPGMLMTGQKRVKVQSYLECCNANISQPLMDKCKELGVTQLIRGQRLDEGHKSPARDGDVVMGICFRQPIENWSSEQVLQYLAERMEIPEHFKLAHSSLDCYDCTAYARDTADRVIWARKHPSMAAEYEARRTDLLMAIKPYVDALSGQ